MYGLVDFRGTQGLTTGEHAGLLAYARQIVGARLLFARRGYPDELKLHFGTLVQMSGPKGRTLTRGSYVLGSVASAWSYSIAPVGVTILTNSPLAPLVDPAKPPSWFAPLTEEKLDKLLVGAGEATVTALQVPVYPEGFGLTLSFSDASVLAIVPTPNVVTHEGDRELPPVPDWELFTPFHRYLRVGPGATWAYEPSDKPESMPEKSAN